MIEVAVLCLALNIYHEARSEPVRGQYAVAQVTMNRAGGAIARVCPAVFKPHQFSWTTEHAQATEGGYRLKPSGRPTEPAAWALAVHIARMVITEGDYLPDVTKGATHYHTHAVSPQWGDQEKKTTVIGNHVFYRLL